MRYCSTSFSAAGGHGHQAGHSVGREPVTGNAVVTHQNLRHGIGPAAAQVDVGGQLAHIVGVAHHMQLQASLLLEQGANLVQRCLAGRLNVGLVRIKQDAVDGNPPIGIQALANLAGREGFHLLLARLGLDLDHGDGGALLELFFIAVGRGDVGAPGQHRQGHPGGLVAAQRRSLAVPPAAQAAGLLSPTLPAHPAGHSWRGRLSVKMWEPPQASPAHSKAVSKPAAFCSCWYPRSTSSDERPAAFEAPVYKPSIS